MKLMETNCIAPNLYSVMIAVDAQELEVAAQAAYDQTKGNFLVTGYEKGMAPRAVIEAKNGDIFASDGLNNLLAEHGITFIMQGCEDAGVQPLSLPEPALASKDETGCTVTLTVATMPKIVLGAYKDVTVPYPKAVIKASAVDDELLNLRKNIAKKVSHANPAQMGDTVTIDFCGLIDGTAFKGGSAEKFSLELGSNRFIPGFEEQIVGHCAGESFDIFVSFPAQYAMPQMAAKDAVFQIVLHEVSTSELPELTDELVVELTKGKGSSVEQLRTQIEAVMQKRKEEQARQTAESCFLERLAKEAEIEDIPQALIEDEYQELIETINAHLRLVNTRLSDYLTQIGLTKESFEAQNRANAAQTLRGKLVLYAIAKQEAFTVTPEEIQAYVEDIAPKRQYTIETYQAQFPAYKIEWQLLIQKAIAFVMSNVKFMSVENS